MSENRIRRFARISVIAVCLGLPLGSATASPLNLNCATRDRQVLMLLEQRANGASHQAMTDALNTMMDARITCHEGRVLDALSIYDGIAQGFAGHSPEFGQRP